MNTLQKIQGLIPQAKEFVELVTELFIQSEGSAPSLIDPTPLNQPSSNPAADSLIGVWPLKQWEELKEFLTGYSMFHWAAMIRWVMRGRDSQSPKGGDGGTPETEAEIARQHSLGNSALLGDFARQLERQRDTARAELARLQQEVATMRNAGFDPDPRRLEEELAKVNTQLNDAHLAHSDLAVELAKVKGRLEEANARLATNIVYTQGIAWDAQQRKIDTLKSQLETSQKEVEQLSKGQSELQTRIEDLRDNVDVRTRWMLAVSDEVLGSGSATVLIPVLEGVRRLRQSQAGGRLTGPKVMEMFNNLRIMAISFGDHGRKIKLGPVSAQQLADVLNSYLTSSWTLITSDPATLPTAAHSDDNGDVLWRLKDGNYENGMWNSEKWIESSSHWTSIPPLPTPAPELDAFEKAWPNIASNIGWSPKAITDKDKARIAYAAGQAQGGDAK